MPKRASKSLPSHVEHILSAPSPVSMSDRIPTAQNFLLKIPEYKPYHGILVVHYASEEAYARAVELGEVGENGEFLAIPERPPAQEK